MIKWKDVTKDKSGSPRILQAKIGYITVMVRQYAGYGDKWYVTINEYGIQRADLGTGVENEDVAKERSMLLLQAAVQDQIKKLQAIEEELFVNEAY